MSFRPSVAQGHVRRHLTDTDRQNKCLPDQRMKRIGDFLRQNPRTMPPIGPSGAPAAVKLALLM
jgi:hypothetical protein